MSAYYCLVCQRPYDTDLSLLASSSSSRLPLKCSRCEQYCCASCIGLNEPVRLAKCPHCRKKGFDRENPAICLSLIRSRQNNPNVSQEESTVIDLLTDDESVPPDTLKSESSHASPVSVIDPNAPKGSGEGSFVSARPEKKRDQFKHEDTASSSASLKAHVKRVKTGDTPPEATVGMPKTEQCNNEEDSLSSQENPPAVVSSRPTAIRALKSASQGGSVRRQDTIQRAIQVKLEQSSANKEECEKVERKQPKSRLDELPLERRARAEAWLNANVDPETGQGRKTFRRGCHRQCITTILGGMGTHESPLIKNPPNYPQGAPNPFIVIGEFYMAGRGDWNPWGPSFPGDTGLIDSQCLISSEAELENGFDRTKQESFHYFVQCSKHPWEDHYHGRDARGSYLYVGKYRRVPRDPDEEVEETARTFLFSQLSDESQTTMAAWHCAHQRAATWYDQGVERRAGPRELLPFLNGGEETVEAWITMLRTLQYRIEIVPVDFVEYDEELYKALKKVGANNGQVAIDFDNIGPV